MRIDFESAGGYAGLQLEYHIDTDDLSHELAQELRTLVEGSDLFNLDTSELQPSGGGPPDVMTYRLSVAEGGRRVSLTCNDVSAPASLQPLLARLRQLALQQKK